MFVFISHLAVPAEDRAELEAHFRARSGLVDDFPGFLYLQLLRPQSATGDTSHVFLTAWESRDAFRRYMQSAEHAISHDREPGKIMARIGHPAMFAEYVRWLDALLRARQVDTTDVVRSLHLTERVARERMSADAAAAVAHMIRAGLDALAAPESA